MKTSVLAGLFVAGCMAAAACGSSASNGDGNGNSSSSSSSGGSSNGSDGGGVSSSGGDGGGSGGTSSSSGATSSSSSGGSSSGSSSGTKDGGTVIGSTGVTVIVSPDTGLEAQIVNAIKGATKSVYMTMYILDDTDIINELVDQKKAGLDVEVVLNQTFPTGTTESNPTTYTTLQNAGIGVVWRNGPPGATSGAYTHEKTFIIDGTQAWIMTINLDKSSYLYNREYVVIDNQAADVAEAQAVFLADYAGTANSDGNPLVVSPTNSRSQIITLINSATKTLDIEVEEFSDDGTNDVTNAVAAVAKKGIPTRLILANATPSTNQTEAITTVKAAGVKVVVSGGEGGTSTATNPYIHAKAITVDCTGTTCTSGYIGSENLTGGSLGYNRELGLLITNQTELAKVQTAINTDFAAGTAQ